MTPTRITVVGNPENRRVALFRAAVLAAGLPAPVVVPWRRAAAGQVEIDPATVVRIESPGEDAEVDRLLRGVDHPALFGEIVGAAASYRGMCATVEAVAATGASLLNRADDIAIMCDKRRCHRMLSAAGVPVPAALPVRDGYAVDGGYDVDGYDVDGYAALRRAMADVGWSRVFVKPAHGSSASGVLALALGPNGRLRAITSVEIAGERLFNSLQVRAYQRESDVAAIVDRLAPDGLHVERWYPKATLDGHPMDLRVVVIAGRPTHAVVRVGRSPMTNLHLGGGRGDLATVRAAAGAAGWAAALDSCVRAAGCLPGSLQVGVDLMFDRRWRTHAIVEVNAFGDLLPGLLVDGRDTYAQQVHALVSGQWAAWSAERSHGVAV